MMKWLRKYNKQIMGVAASFLLVVWLGGDALQSAARRNTENDVLARTASGPITRGDQQRAEFETELQRLVGFDWRGQWSRIAGAPLEITDWILLNREADRAGIRISVEDVRRLLGQNDQLLRRVQDTAIKKNVTVEQVYEALVGYFKVDRLAGLYQATAALTDQELRVAARDQFDRATINAVKLPAASFTDPQESFTEEQIVSQFEKYKDNRRVPNSQTFGYYREPSVTIQYVKIDPKKVQDLLQVGEQTIKKRALDYWKQNRDKDSRFRRTQEEIDAILSAMPEQKDADGNPLPKPPVPPYHEKFEQVQDVAIEIVKEREAHNEAERLANQLIRKFAEPWFGVPTPRNDYRPAPEMAAHVQHYDDILAQWPPYQRYKDAITVATLGPVTEADLAQDTEMGSAFFAAFTVQGLAEIPAETNDRSMYKSLWETASEFTRDQNGNVYVYRVIKSEKGRPPTGVDEVRDEVIADLRMASAMKRAVEAGQTLADAANDSSLKEAWESNQALADRVTPDEGGYLSDVPVSRNNPFWGRLVPQIGEVDEQFVQTAFRLAKAGEDAPPEVVRLDDLNLAVVIEGKSVSPVYQETYEQQRLRLTSQMSQQRMIEAFRNWLQPEQIRDRNGYKLGDKDADDESA